MNDKEIKVPVIKLKDYLDEVGITVTALAQLSDINKCHLRKCLVGEVDCRNGIRRTLSADNLARLQDTLHQLSLQLRHLFIYYNSDKEVVKHNGSRYCPDCASQIKELLSPYFNILPFVQYVFGWSRCKTRNIIDNKRCTSYGNFTQDDCNRINIVLSEIATRLDAITLVQD